MLSGASGGGLSTTVQPAASAADTFHAAMVTGAFQGTIAATTPTGNWSTSPARSPDHDRRSNSKARMSSGVVVEDGCHQAGLGARRLADGAAHLLDGDAGDVVGALAEQVGGAGQHLGPFRRRHARPRPVVEGGPGGTDGAVDVGLDGDRHLTHDDLGGGRDDAHPLVPGRRRPPAPDEEVAAVHQAIVHGCEGNR